MTFIFTLGLRNEKGGPRVGWLTEIKRLFGEGKIRVEGETEDGRTFVTKIPYVGDPSTMTPREIIQHVKNEIRVEHGLRVKSARIVAMTKQ